MRKRSFKKRDSSVVSESGGLVNHAVPWWTLERSVWETQWRQMLGSKELRGWGMRRWQMEIHPPCRAAQVAIRPREQCPWLGNPGGRNVRGPTDRSSPRQVRGCSHLIIITHSAFYYHYGRGAKVGSQLWVRKTAYSCVIIYLLITILFVIITKRLMLTPVLGQYFTSTVSPFRGLMTPAASTKVPSPE